MAGLDLATEMAATGLVLVVSFVFAMLGLGGGMLYVPILKWLGLPLKTAAIPLGLLLNGLNTLLAFLRYAREGLVDFRGGAPAAVAALVAAPLGAYCIRYLPRDLLVVLFAAAVTVAGLRSLASRRPAVRGLSGLKRLVAGAGTGAAAGFLGGLLGIGGGFLIAPVLMELGYEPKHAAGTTAFVVTFSSFSGFLGHAFGALPPLRILVLTMLAVVVGSQLGAWFMARKAQPQWVRAAYGVLLLGVAGALGWEILAPRLLGG
jgi:hypothetical protein